MHMSAVQIQWRLCGNGLDSGRPQAISNSLWAMAKVSYAPTSTSGICLRKRYGMPSTIPGYRATDCAVPT
eukprot:3333145-Rhodomonas_salina.1